MTEEEAKKKICPQLFCTMTMAAIEAAKEGAKDEIIDGFAAKSACIGSGCMMWV